MNDPFAGLSRAELESLLKRTLIYAVWLLKHYGNARYHPDLDPEDLVCRVIDDTWAGRRNGILEDRLEFNSPEVVSEVMSHTFLNH